MTEKGLHGGEVTRLRSHRTDGDSLGLRAGNEPGATWIPGVAAGLAGFAVFLVLHAVWIIPIWFVAPLGLIIGSLGGVAVNWAYLHVESHLPAGYIYRWVALAGGAVLILSPSLLVAWAGDPYFVVIDGASVPTASVSGIVVRFVVEFLVVTTLAGALLGWLVTRTRSGTVAVAVAAFAFAIGPGHNLPFFHIWSAPGPTQTGLLLTLASIMVASATFVAVDALLSGGTARAR